MGWSKKVDMALTEDDKLDLIGVVPEAVKNTPDYPYGLRITLSHRELDKLGLEADCTVGMEIDLDVTARVTGVFRTETAAGPEDRVELQIVSMAAEDDGDEDDE